MPKLPSVSGERVVRALKRAGFIELRQLGEKLYRTVVPMHSSLSKGTLSDILKQRGISVAQFVELL